MSFDRRVRMSTATGAPDSGASGDDEELASDDLPKQRNLQIKTNHPERRLRTLRHGVREELSDLLLNLKACHGQGFGERELSEREIVIEEVPVLACQDPDVGPERNEEAAGLEAAEGLADCCLEGGLLAELLEEIAGEGDVGRPVGQRTGQGSILL